VSLTVHRNCDWALADESTRLSNPASYVIHTGGVLFPTN